MIRVVFLNFALVLCLLTAGINNALAIEPNPPLKDWVVRPIQQKSDTGVSYCSMKNEYKSGQELAFAKDMKGSNTIGIDFKQPAVEVGRQYAVIVSSGSAVRKVTAIAATNEVMVMQMGNDSEFYEALGRSRTLSFKVGNREFEYHLYSGMANSLKFLNDCAEGIKSGGSFEQVTIAMGKDIPDENVSAKQLEKEAQKETAPKLEPKSKEAKSAPPKVSKARKKTTVKRSIKRTKGEAPTASASSQLKAQLIKLKRQNEKLIEENQQIQLALLSKEKQKVLDQESSQRRQDLQNELVSLKEEQKRLALIDAEGFGESQKMLIATQSHQEQILSEIARLKEENRQLILSSKAEREANRQQIIDNRSEMERLKAENDRLALENKVQEEESKKQVLASQIDQNEIRTEIMRLKARNNELALTLEKGKREIIDETRAIKEQSQRVASEARAGIAESKQLALAAQSSQQQIKQETLRLREQNQNIAQTTAAGQQQIKSETAKIKEDSERLAAQVKAKQEENRRLAIEAQQRQEKINADILRLREENQKLFEQMQNIGQERQMIVSHVIAEPLPISAANSPIESLKYIVNISQAIGYAPIEEAYNNNQKYYKWVSDNIYGSLQEIPYMASQDFNRNVDDYMRHLENKCEGDFAKTNGATKLVGSYKMLEAEMACMTDQQDAAVALLFVLAGGKLHVITQEGTAGLMPEALKKRDMIISSAYNM